MEALGVASSVIGIAGFGLQLSQTLYQFVSTTLGAKESLRDIRDGINLAASAMKQVHGFLQEESERLQRGGEPMLVTASALEDVKGAVDNCLIIFWRIEATITSQEGRKLEQELVQRLIAYNKELKANKTPDILKPDAKLASLSKRGQLKWWYIAPKLEQYNNQLHRQQSSLQLIFSIISIRAIQNKPKQQDEDLMVLFELIARVKRMATYVDLPEFGRRFSSYQRQRQGSIEDSGKGKGTHLRIDSPAGSAGLDSIFSREDVQTFVRVVSPSRRQLSPSSIISRSSSQGYRPDQPSKRFPFPPYSMNRQGQSSSSANATKAGHLKSKHNSHISLKGPKATQDHEKAAANDTQSDPKARTSVKFDLRRDSYEGEKVEERSKNKMDAFEAISLSNEEPGNESEQGSDYDPIAESSASASKRQTAEPNVSKRPSSKTSKNTSTTMADSTGGVSNDLEAEHAWGSFSFRKAKKGREREQPVIEETLELEPPIEQDPKSKLFSEEDWVWGTKEKKGKGKDGIIEEVLEIETLIEEPPASKEYGEDDWDFFSWGTKKNKENKKKKEVAEKEPPLEPVAEIIDSEMFENFAVEEIVPPKRRRRTHLPTVSETRESSSSAEVKGATTSAITSEERIVVVEETSNAEPIAPSVPRVVVTKPTGVPNSSTAIPDRNIGTIQRRLNRRDDDSDIEYVTPRRRGRTWTISDSSSLSTRTSSYLSQDKAEPKSKVVTAMQILRGLIVILNPNLLGEIVLRDEDLTAYIIRQGQIHLIPHSGSLSLKRKYAKNLRSQSTKQSWYKTFAFLDDEEMRALQKLLYHEDLYAMARELEESEKREISLQSRIVHLEKRKDPSLKFWKNSKEVLFLVVKSLNESAGDSDSIRSETLDSWNDRRRSKTEEATKGKSGVKILVMGTPKVANDQSSTASNTPAPNADPPIEPVVVNLPPPDPAPLRTHVMPPPPPPTSNNTTAAQNHPGPPPPPAAHPISSQRPGPPPPAPGIMRGPPMPPTNFQPRPPGLPGPPGPPGAPGLSPLGHNRWRSVTTPKVTDQMAIKELARYEVWTIQKSEPGNSEIWDDCLVTRELLLASEIEKQLEILNKDPETVLQKRIALSQDQQDQIDRIITRTMELELDQNFEWLLCQIGVTRVKRKKVSLVSAISIYLQRSPRRGINPITLHQSIERAGQGRMAQSNPPPQMPIPMPMPYPPPPARPAPTTAQRAPVPGKKKDTQNSSRRRTSSVSSHSSSETSYSSDYTSSLFSKLRKPKHGKSSRNSRSKDYHRQDGSRRSTSYGTRANPFAPPPTDHRYAPRENLHVRAPESLYNERLEERFGPRSTASGIIRDYDSRERRDSFAPAKDSGVYRYPTPGPPVRAHPIISYAPSRPEDEYRDLMDRQIQSYRLDSEQFLRRNNQSYPSNYDTNLYNPRPEAPGMESKKEPNQDIVEQLLLEYTPSAPEKKSEDQNEEENHTENRGRSPRRQTSRQATVDEGNETDFDNKKGKDIDEKLSKKGQVSWEDPEYAARVVRQTTIDPTMDDPRTASYAPITSERPWNGVQYMGYPGYEPYRQEPRVSVSYGPLSRVIEPDYYDDTIHPSLGRTTSQYGYPEPSIRVRSPERYGSYDDLYDSRRTPGVVHIHPAPPPMAPGSYPKPPPIPYTVPGPRELDRRPEIIVRSGDDGKEDDELRSRGFDYGRGDYPRPPTSQPSRYNGSRGGW